MKESTFLNKQLDYHKITLIDYWADTLVNSVYISSLIFDVLANNFVNANSINHNPNIEHGAFLLGNYLKNTAGSYDITIDYFIKVKAEEQSNTNIQFGSEAWMTLDKEMEKNPTLKIIGWFHTHPGHGIFLSRDDLNVSYTYFNKPYQIALLLDNHLSSRNNQLELGIFSYKKNGEINNY